MKFTKLVPNVFYTDIQDGLNLFIDCLGFTVAYDELKSKDPLCVASQGDLSIFIIQSKEYADMMRPEFRLQTDNIEEAYGKISASHPEFLHPNLKVVTLRPWGAREFALADRTGVCIIIQQW